MSSRGVNDPALSRFQEIGALCAKHTYLSAQDVAIIGSVASRLDLFADTARADILISVPTKSLRAALVVAQAQPRTVHPVGSGSLVGQPVLYENEPDIIQAQNTGAHLYNHRENADGVKVARSIVPVKNERGWTIGCLIMERDVSEEARATLRAERLEHLTERLSGAFLELSGQGDVLASLLNEGVLLSDHAGTISYANRSAVAMLARSGGLVGRRVDEVLPGLGFDALLESRSSVLQELEMPGCVLSVQALPLLGPENIVGACIVVRNLTELRDREQAVLKQGSVIREIHHRVKNNLQTVASVLRLQARRAESVELRQTYAESINRIMTMALVHEILSHEPNAFINAKEAVGHLVRTAAQTMASPSQSIMTEVRGEDLYLESDVATTLCMIINELVQNCFKHAFTGMAEGKMVISLSRKDDLFYVDVWDNGIGMELTNGETDKAGLGLKLVDTLVRQLKGDVVIKSIYGTQVSLSFPANPGEGKTR